MILERDLAAKVMPKFGFSRVCVIPRKKKRARWFKSEPKDRELREETIDAQGTQETGPGDGK